MSGKKEKRTFTASEDFFEDEATMNENIVDIDEDSIKKEELEAFEDADKKMSKLYIKDLLDSSIVENEHRLFPKNVNPVRDLFTELEKTGVENLPGFDIDRKKKRGIDTMTKEELTRSARTQSSVERMVREDPPKRINYKQKNIIDFLKRYSHDDFKEALSEYVLCQEEVVDDVATFVLYHLRRQLSPDLPVASLLITGPSGTGKTESLRTAQKICDGIFNIHIIDGSTLTKDGWSGSNKLVDHLGSLKDGDIVVVDEFDKMTTPSYNSKGGNVSQELQTEFLKLLEGDMTYSDETTSSWKVKNFKTIGVIFAGAFEDIRGKKRTKKNVIGFNDDQDYVNQVIDDDIDVEDLIAHGIIPELAGRIKKITETNELTPENCLKIIKGKQSGVSKLLEKMKGLNIDCGQYTSDEYILEMAKKSLENHLGVRWVQSQIENELTELMVKAEFKAESYL